MSVDERSQVDPVASLEAQALAASAAIPGWLSDNEARALFGLVAKSTSDRPICCEIGSWLGKSSVVLATALRGKIGGTLYCIDPFDLVAGDPWVSQTLQEQLQGPVRSWKEAFSENLRRHEVEDRVVLIEGFSHLVRERFHEPLDFLFIDGDHRYESVLRDFGLWTGLLKPGGVVAFHDYHPYENQHDGVRHVIERFLMPDGRWLDQRVVDSLYIAVKSAEGIEFEATAAARATMVPGWLSETEARELFKLVIDLESERPTCCEIGAWLGKNTVVLGTALQGKGGGKLYSVDPFDLAAGDSSVQTALRQDLPESSQSQKAVFLENVHRYGLADVVVPMEAFSYQLAGHFRDELDFLLIDGAHGYDSVRQDVSLWARRLKPGGVVAFHDYFMNHHHDGPRLIVEQYVRHHFGWVDQRLTESLYVAVRSQAGVEFETRALAAADTIPGWLSENEQRELFNLTAALSAEAPVCCEIGSWLGKSSIVIGTALKGKGAGKLYCVDLFDVREDDAQYQAWFEEQMGKTEVSRLELFRANMRRHDVASVTIPLAGRSEELGASFDEPIDLLFIDGDHSYEGVKRDFEQWSRLLKPGGVIAFHDFHHAEFGPRRVVMEECVDNPTWLYPRVVDNMFIAMKAPDS